MLKPALLSCCLLTLGLVTAQADELVVPSNAPQAAPAPAPAPVSLPAKGETMSQVIRRFGQPQVKHKPAGGDTPKHPPITRWDYPGFSVYFEHTHVVDAVVPGEPPHLYHTDKLQAAS